MKRQRNEADLSLVEPVTNAIPDARGTNLFRADRDAAAIFSLYVPEDLYGHLESSFDRLGMLAGGHLDELAASADRNPPVLKSRTRTGENFQAIEKHPAYREMERIAYSTFGLAAMSHRGGVLGWPEPMHPAAKYAFTYLFAQAEFGLLCPVSMTDSLARTLKRYGNPALVEKFIDRLTSLDIDDLAQGAMFMTEQGAGSDIAATSTKAERQSDGTWKLYGDKWFCSNPDAELALVLARSEPQTGLAGVSLFLLPRHLDGGVPNAYRIVRLKDKLGTRSMASGEITLEGAEAYLVGEPGRGFQQMADMVNNSRLSNGVRATGLMRRAVTEALHVSVHRSAFGKRLVDLPLMRRQLVKMILAAEESRTMVFLTAGALHKANQGDEDAAKLARILTPLLKFRSCRDARRVTGDAMEVRGGCGYIEEWSDPRILRDAHLGSIWEGTSNIVALDVLRAIRRNDVLPSLRAYVETLLEASRIDESDRKSFDAVVARAFDYAERVASDGLDVEARQAASGLYHVVAMSGFASEATALNLSHRLTLAKLVCAHKLLPRDPLSTADDDVQVNELIDVFAKAVRHASGQAG